MCLTRALEYIKRVMLLVADLPNIFQSNVEILKGPVKLSCFQTIQCVAELKVRSVGTEAASWI